MEELKLIMETLSNLGEGAGSLLIWYLAAQILEVLIPTICVMFIAYLGARIGWGAMFSAQLARKYNDNYLYERTKKVILAAIDKDLKENGPVHKR